MFWKFRRMPRVDPLQVAMTGVKMGERYLQLFCSDAVLTEGLAKKSGLSGEAAIWAPDAEHAARAHKAGANAGALIDVQTTPPGAWPWTDDAFDMVVVDNTGGGFSGLDDVDRAALLGSARRVLRPGGRLEIIERARAVSTSEDTLRASGLRSVRTLAEQDGFRFVEGLNA